MADCRAASGSGVTVGGLGYLLQVELGRVVFASRQLNRKDGFALGLIGQVYEEQLIEASLADEFGRERSYVVASGGNEHRSLSVLHPGEKRRQDARRDAGINRSRIRSASGEDLLQFVDP
jgi:hypothetical protein